MIIENGKIEFKTKAIGGIDPSTGYPVKPTLATWGNPTPCNIKPIRENILAVAAMGTNYRARSYEVCMESDAAVVSEQIRLSDLKGNVIGEFSLIQVELLEAVGIVRIIV